MGCDAHLSMTGLAVVFVLSFAISGCYDIHGTCRGAVTKPFSPAGDDGAIGPPSSPTRTVAYKTSQLGIVVTMVYL
jgi:hypothetical protein